MSGGHSHDHASGRGTSQRRLAVAFGIALVVLGVAFSLLGDGLADVLRAEQ